MSELQKALQHISDYHERQRQKAPSTEVQPLPRDGLTIEEALRCAHEAGRNGAEREATVKYFAGRVRPEPEGLEALREIARIIEGVDNRCAAADGPVTPTLKEMTQDEISRIYALAARSGGATPAKIDEPRCDRGHAISDWMDAYCPTCVRLGLEMIPPQFTGEERERIRARIFATPTDGGAT